MIFLLYSLSHLYNVICWILKQILSSPSLLSVNFNQTQPSFTKSTNYCQVCCDRCIYLNYLRLYYIQGALHSTKTFKFSTLLGLLKAAKTESEREMKSPRNKDGKYFEVSRIFRERTICPNGKYKSWK